MKKGTSLQIFFKFPNVIEQKQKTKNQQNKGAKKALKKENQQVCFALKGMNSKHHIKKNNTFQCNQVVQSWPVYPCTVGGV